MTRGDRKRQAWKAPAEIQNHPKSGNQRVQVRDRNGRCRIAFADKVDWTAVTEWRWV